MSKVLLIGDTHFGEKSDSDKHNQQLVELFEWVCSEFKGKVDHVVQMGDYFHHRTKLHLTTLEYGVEGAKILSEAFGRENVYVITGNHDIHYSDRLDVTSLRAIEEHVTLLEAPESLFDGKVMATPWIINQDQWDAICAASKSHDFLLGHFELNGFLMNDYYEVKGSYSHKELRGYKKVFSGHYHSVQEKDNVTYVGTPIPMSMNEANKDMGVWILDLDTGDSEFVVYDKVKVVSIPYTEIDKIEDYDPENTSIRIEFPDDLDDETLISEVSDVLSEMKFSDVKIKYKGNKAKKLLELDVAEIEEIEDIDSAVLTFIEKSAVVEGIDKDELMSLYKLAKTGANGD